MPETIEGLQELQDYNLKLIAGIRGPYMVQAVKTAGAAVHRYTVGITHVVSGALRASHRLAVDSPRRMAIVSIDQSARNPRSNANVAEYAVTEHDRGGSHAFYERTYRDYGDKAGEIGLDDLMESVRNGR